MVLFKFLGNNASRLMTLAIVGGKSGSARISNYWINDVLKTKYKATGLPPARLVSSFISKTDGTVHLSEEDLGLRIVHKNWPQAVYLPFVWLRDHCRCDQCYSHVTLQRQAIIDPIWLTIKPSDVTANSNILRLTWPDGHKTTFDLSWIWNNTFEGKRHIVPPLTALRRLWSAKELKDLGGIPRVSFRRFMDQEETVAELIRHLVSVGICIVEEAPVTTEGTKETAERLCAIQNTFWGSMHHLEVDPSGDDLAYSNKPLPPHVDGNYSLHGPGLQVFHALEASPTGGETTLVDSFSVASRISKEDLALLSSTPIVFEYRDKNGKVYLNTDTIFKYHPVTGELLQLRYCPNDVAPLSSIQPSDILRFYQTYSRFVREVNGEEAIFLHSLAPGEVLFVDNYRVMHGRRGFSGRRVLSGCYLGRTDFLCKARMLKVIE